MWQNVQWLESRSPLLDIDSNVGEKLVVGPASDSSKLTGVVSAATVERRCGSRERRPQRDRATTAAVIACQCYNVELAMEIADLFNDDDVHNARSDTAAAAASRGVDLVGPIPITPFSSPSPKCS